MALAQLGLHLQKQWALPATQKKTTSETARGSPSVCLPPPVTHAAPVPPAAGHRGSAAPRPPAPASLGLRRMSANTRTRKRRRRDASAFSSRPVPPTNAPSPFPGEPTAAASRSVPPEQAAASPGSAGQQPQGSQGRRDPSRPRAGERGRGAARQRRPGRTPATPPQPRTGRGGRPRQSRRRPGKPRRTGAPASRSHELALAVPVGRRSETGGCPPGGERAAAPAPRAPLWAAPPRASRRAARPVPSRPTRGPGAHLGAELSPCQRCPPAAKPPPAASGAHPRGPPGAPAPRAPPPHLLPAEAPHRPLACGAGRRGRETPPRGPAVPPARRGAAAVVKGAESGGRAGAARGRGCSEWAQRERPPRRGGCCPRVRPRDPTRPDPPRHCRRGPAPVRGTGRGCRLLWAAVAGSPCPVAPAARPPGRAGAPSPSRRSWEPRARGGPVRSGAPRPAPTPGGALPPASGLAGRGGQRLGRPASTAPRTAPASGCSGF